MICSSVFLLHAWYYRFMTDDAFITFQYAKNFIHGDGLVFNAGMEKVEGYTNFLWLLWIAFMMKAGFSPDVAAMTSSMVLSVVLLFILQKIASAFIHQKNESPFIFLFLMAVSLSATLAVWSSSGLETRLFECLLFGGLGLLITFRNSSRPGHLYLSVLLFSLAALTRPDGLLFFAVTFGSLVFTQFGQRISRKQILKALIIGVILVGGHYLFRWIYYQDLFPNTYYVKVGNQARWEFGLNYLTMFCLEYHIYLWTPFILSGLTTMIRQRLQIELSFALATLAHTIYIVSIGGDHFEYRPLGIFLIFIYYLSFTGAVFLFRCYKTPLLYLLKSILILLLIDMPLSIHHAYPSTYVSGFPGQVISPTSIRFDSLYSGSLLSRRPFFEPVYRAHYKLFMKLSSCFIGLRQAEHKLFLAMMDIQADIMQDLVSKGVLNKDTYIALDCVGIISYKGGVKILDRLGLNDKTIAKAPENLKFRMAHSKRAEISYALKRGCDFWLVDMAYPFLLKDVIMDDQWSLKFLLNQSGLDNCYYATLSENLIFLVKFCKPYQEIIKKYPLIKWNPASELLLSS